MAQTIVQIQDQNLYDKIDKLIVGMSSRYHMKNRFGVGEGYNRKEFLILQRMQKVLCKCGVLEDCEVEYINKIINEM